jgi:hypothetical protein
LVGSRQRATPVVIRRFEHERDLVCDPVLVAKHALHVDAEFSGGQW